MLRKSNKKQIIILQILLGSVIFLVFILNIYLPRYLLNKDKVESRMGNSENSNFCVMTYNIRCWSLFDIGKKSWFYRAELVIENIRSVQPDIIAFQEVTAGQYRYLQNKLEYCDSVIEYRDEMPWSEGCPIFYNSDRYELLETETFWLSETPDEMSKSWGASEYRICSYVILFDKKNKLEIAIFNTHLDHKSEEAQIKGIEIIYNKINEMENIPTILLGDFNVTEEMITYDFIRQYFTDTKYEAISYSTGHGSTYQNWGQELGNLPIDYIMVSPQVFLVEYYEILEQTYSGVYPSDHFPVWVELKSN